MSDYNIEPWTIETSDELFDARIFKLRRNHSRLAKANRSADFYVLDSPDWVSVVPITPDNQVLLVAQYRHGTGEVSLEIPAGMLEPGEEVLAAAQRELREETGYSAQSWRMLTQTDANPAFMTNRFTAVLAQPATLTDPTAWDEHEELEPVLVPLADIPTMLQTGQIRNTYTVLPLCWYLWEVARNEEQGAS